MRIERILECVRKTNPEMTMERMLEELSKCKYSSVALCMVCENDNKLLQTGKSMVY